MTAKEENEVNNDLSMERLEKDVGFPKRYVLALMVFLGFSVLYALRVNLNVAIGAMCNNHTIYENGFYVNKVRCYVSCSQRCVILFNFFITYLNCLKMFQPTHGA